MGNKKDEITDPEYFGNLVITKTNEEILDTLQIYIQASTKAVKSASDVFFVSLRIHQEVNFSPYFKESLPENLTLDLSTDGFVSYQIPTYDDMNADGVVLSVEQIDKLRFAKFSSKNHSLNFYGFLEEDIGIYYLYITLTDEHGLAF